MPNHGILGLHSYGLALRINLFRHILVGLGYLLLRHCELQLLYLFLLLMLSRGCAVFFCITLLTTTGSQGQ